jgi:hypothetical protein
VLLNNQNWGQKMKKKKKKLGEVGLLGLCERSEKWGNGGETWADSGGVAAVQR